MKGLLKPCLFVVLCSPALGQSLNGFDPDRLFADHADEVQHEPDGAEILNLPYKIQITRRDGEVVAVDMGIGAAGCFLGLMARLRPMGEQCMTLTPEQRMTADERLARITRFFAANSYPSVSEDAVRQMLVAENMPDDSCEMAREEGWMGAVPMYLYEPAGELMLRAMVSVPRLPVANPCL